MKSFDDFWNGVFIPKSNALSEAILEDSKNAETTAEVMADFVVRYSKLLLESYHEWLISNLE